MEYLTRFITLFSLLGISVGCSNLSPRHPVLVDQLYRAQILPGVPAVRAWAGTFSKKVAADLVESVHQEKQAMIRKDASGRWGIKA